MSNRVSAACRGRRFVKFRSVVLVSDYIDCQKLGISGEESFTRSYVLCSSFVYFVCASFKSSSCFMLSFFDLPPRLALFLLLFSYIFLFCLFQGNKGLVWLSSVPISIK